MNSLIQKELLHRADIKWRDKQYIFFKNQPVKLHGVRTPIVRQLARKRFNEVKKLNKKEIFDLCEKLLETCYYEEQTIALDWLYRIQKSYTKEDFTLFEQWLEKYISNWALCDDFCCHSFGYFIFQFPEFFVRLPFWAKSENPWFRRASAVILIFSLRRRKALQEAFEIADLLLQDKEDLVQKGYGWMLKEASKKFPKEVYKFILQRKEIMPRTALRYSIEKFPEEWKKNIMK